MRFSRCVSLGFVVFASAVAAQAQQSKLFAGDGSSGDEFGSAVDIDGDTCVVGAWSDDDQGYTDLGAAYVFRKLGGTWVQEAKLAPADLANSRYFGRSVAVQGNVVVVGSNGNGTSNGGAAYVFRRTGTFPFVTWTQEAKLMAQDTFSGNDLGRSVAIDGNTVAVGAPNWQSSRGATYVFVRAGGVWQQQTQVLANDGSGSDFFGWSVALDEGTLLVGAPQDDIYWNDTGSAYVFVEQNVVFAQQAKLGGGLVPSAAHFGWSVDLVGDTCIVGAPDDYGQIGVTTGAAHLFRRIGSTWSSSARITATDGASSDRFGESVALSSTFAIVGAPSWEGTTFNDPGALYVFAPSSGFWVQTGLVTATSLSNSAYYGSSCALAGSTAIVGARNATGAIGSSGAAYVLDSVVGTPTTYCTAKVTSNGCTPAMTFSGTPSYTSPAPFLVGAQQVLNNKYGFLIYSKTNSAATPFQGGYLCLQPPVQRTPTLDSGGTAAPANDCSGTFSFDFNAYAQSGFDPQLLPGQVVWSQYWFRDPQSSSTTGLTNALQFVMGI